jgi:hypothetical protein
MFLLPLRRPCEVERQNERQLTDLAANSVLGSHILTLCGERLKERLPTVLDEGDELAPPKVAMSVFEGKLKLADVRA